MGLNGEKLIQRTQTNKQTNGIPKALHGHHLCVITAGVLQLLRGQLMRLPKEQQLLVQEAHLLLGALAVAQLEGYTGHTKP